MKRNVFFFIVMLLYIIFRPSNIRASESVSIYDGDLGYSYSSTSTEFKIWSSSASQISVVVDGVEEKALTKDQDTNVWIGFVQGDLSGQEYSYNIKYADGTNYTNVLDPYGKYLNQDKTRNIIFNDSVVSFENWHKMDSTLKINDKNKIIYGINIDTFANSQSWNGYELNKGKLLSLNQAGTTYNNTVTGFDHVKNLGITYIELSDLMDSFGGFVVNSRYVSGEYAYSGTLEFRQVINSYYNSHIGVIVSIDLIDLSSAIIENFNKIDKEYFSSSTALDDSKAMVKKYMKDLILHWCKTYKLSGIKFENMGQLETAFINEISRELLEINENIVIYGDGSYSEENVNNAGENNLKNLFSVGMINGSLNYSLFGDVNDKDTKGILSGNYSKEMIESLKFAWLSSVDNGDIDYSYVKGISYKNYWGNESSYSLVNYLGSRNGLSIYDKLRINNISGEKIIEQKSVLAFGTLLISGGIPYIEAGSEFLASYQNFNDNNDSICTSDESFCFYTSANKKLLDWSFAYDNKSITDSFKSLVNFRKSNNTYIQSNKNILKNNVEIYLGEEGVIGYVRKYQKAYVGNPQKIVVIFNYSNNESQVKSFGGTGWGNSYQYNLAKREEETIIMRASSIYFDTKIMQPKVNQWILLIIVIGVIGSIYTLNIFLNKKLVETRGYDIKDINRKYRPFVRRKKTTDKSAKSEEISEAKIDEQEETIDNNEE